VANRTIATRRAATSSTGVAEILRVAVCVTVTGSVVVKVTVTVVVIVLGDAGWATAARCGVAVRSIRKSEK